jgi:hypothetical protein
MAQPLGHVEFVVAVRAGDLVGSGDLFTVQPEVGAVVDSIELKARVSPPRYRSLHLLAEPPGHPKRAVLWHWEVRKIFSRRTLARDVQQVRPEEGILELTRGDESAQDRGWEVDGVPGGRVDPRKGKRAALHGKSRRRTDRPAGVEVAHSTLVPARMKLPL